jgi:peptidoglycan-associated lipoprotein
MKRIPLYLIFTALLAACASETTKPTQTGAQVEDRTQTSKSNTTPSTENTRPLLPPQQQAVNPLKDPSNVLSKRSVFYEYDSFDVKPEYKTLIEAHGNYLSSNPNAHIFLQGNTDERGSREYNLALGQKRADSVRKMMSVMGAKTEQMESVSFGEEKPRAECHEESCWSQNRRTDIMYQGE